MSKARDYKNILSQGLRAGQYEISIGEILGLSSALGIELPTDSLTRAMTLVKSMNQPSTSMNVTTFKWKGHTVHLSGSMEVSPFTITVSNDPKHILKPFFQAWMESNSYFDDNGDLILDGKTADITLVQRDTKSNPVYGWLLKDCFIQEISEIENNSEDTESVSEYTVTFLYSKQKYIPLVGLTDVLDSINSYFGKLSDISKDNFNNEFE